MKKAQIVISLILVFALGRAVWWARSRTAESTTPQPPAQSETTAIEPVPAAETPTVTSEATKPAPAPAAEVVLPIDQFFTRITKKPFGIHITPKNSPVSPERFSGYHTAVDVEYGDVTDDVEVRAIAAGTVVVSRTADGYGGVMVIRHTIDDKSISALYGHLRPSSMLASGKPVTIGQKIAVLGTGYSSETDNERRHLHFGLRVDDNATIKGYVQNESELTGWQDPQQFFKQHGIE